ncbi:MaoC family dehydratase [Pararobbsia silviterrae]|uniref:Acyl dehydratase n=1 Tax=Pararobbsia silviterrae TaxID=1792498 RepID=A0A494Y8L1_9BURK|nr:MaoC family dehydratase [Pararobbsia silviterrae]RKP58736.1 acyl dehydratase [Pararobbsia silviterrae]
MTTHSSFAPKIVRTGEILHHTFQLTPENVRKFANAAEDHNPLHHNTLYAMDSRFGGLIASATQVLSLFMAVPASHYSQAHQPLGLEFGFQLRKAAMATDLLIFRWVVTDATYKDTLEGDIVTLEGTVKNEAGDTLVTGSAKVLVTEKI